MTGGNAIDTRIDGWAWLVLAIYHAAAIVLNTAYKRTVLPVEYPIIKTKAEG